MKKQNKLRRMVKIFRNIRQSLIADRKRKRYFLYALGEILLVVSGILIAVQVNNLNTQRQRSNLERKVLTEIVHNLKGDVLEIQDELESFEIIVNVDSILIGHFQSKLAYSDSIGKLIQIFSLSPHFNPTKSGFDLLESKGIDLISNDALRINLTDIYERSYPYYQKYEDERFQIVQSLFTPYLTKNFYLLELPKWPYGIRIPISYESLLKDPEMISLLQTSSWLASNLHRKANRLKGEMDGLLEQISSFLEQ